MTFTLYSPPCPSSNELKVGNKTLIYANTLSLHHTTAKLPTVLRSQKMTTTTRSTHTHTDAHIPLPPSQQRTGRNQAVYHVSFVHTPLSAQRVQRQQLSKLLDRLAHQLFFPKSHLSASLYTHSHSHKLSSHLTHGNQ